MIGLLSQLGLNVAGGFLGANMSDALTSRDQTPRAIEIVGTAPSADRSLSETRDPISRSGSTAASAATGSNDRWLSPLRENIIPRSFGSVLGSSSDAVVSATGGTIAATTATSATALEAIRRYPGNDPFSVLADIYSSLFGGDNPQAGTTQYSVVPQTVGGSSGNSLLILLILAGAGFAIYWFYFRKGGSSAD